MTYDQIVQAVVVRSNRPDLLAEIELAIRTAVSNYHSMDLFWRDNKTVIVASTNGASSELKINIDPAKRVRTIKEIYPEHCPKDTLLPYNVESNTKDYYRLAGNVLTIKYAKGAQRFILSYFESPLLYPKPDTWLFQLYPTQVINAALLELYLDQRDTSQADRYRVLVGRTREERGTCKHDIWTDQCSQS